MTKYPPLQSQYGFVFRVLPEAYEVLEELVYVGHIEVACHNEIAVHPIVFAQKGVHILDAIFAKSAIAHVSHNHFAYVREFSFFGGLHRLSKKGLL